MNNDKLKMLLDVAITSLKDAMPMLDELQGVIPTDILDRLDFINKLSVAH